MAEHAAGKGWSSTAPPGEFKPFIPSEQTQAEFTAKAVVLGAFFGLAFGAVTVYLALRAGLTVSASIPIAVLAIAIFKRFGATILENNIVQTAGSAGESIAAGVAFTLPALIFLGYQEQMVIGRIFWIALIGGCLGVLFMIPLRRYLIVKEHGNLTYPEGTACADVLVAGERGGSFAGRVFWGLGLGAVYKFLNEGLRFWNNVPTYSPAWYPGSTIAAAITPEYLGVGFILGVRIGGIIVAGSVLSWLVLIPMIKFFGQSIPEAIFPSPLPISQMSAPQVWSAYIRPIGAGAVTMAGLITLMRTFPTIVDSLKAALGDLFGGKGKAAEARTRIEQDLPLGGVFVGSVVLVLAVWLFLYKWHLVPGLFNGLVAALLVVVFGFLFVTVSSRIVGIIGSSSNPISGMTIATLMATCLIFLSVGWSGGAYAAVALSIGAVVCIAAANAGATSQDLKTGYLVGATPWRQQVALIIGVLASVTVIGWTLTFLNQKYTRVEPRDIAVTSLPAEARAVGNISFQGKDYQMVTYIGSGEVPDGTYYYDSAQGKLAWQHQHGIGSLNFPAPQAVLMGTVINGILRQSLPWRLVLLGVFISVVMELCGVRSLAFAVGAYLPISTTLPIFFGGVMSWLVGVSMKEKAETGEVSSGGLFGAGLIAGGSIAGLFGVVWLEAARIQAAAFAQQAGQQLSAGQLPYAIGDRYWPALAQSDVFGVFCFLVLAGILFWFGRKRLENV